MTRFLSIAFLLAIASLNSLTQAAAPAPDDVIRTAGSGPWSKPTTWVGGKVPGARSKVLIRPGHRVVYDVCSDEAIRIIAVGGVLRFEPTKDTKLTVGLIKIQPGEVVSEEGFDCDAHAPEVDPTLPQPALEVGTPEQPIPAGKTATIRLALLNGMNKETCPAIVCCGGRMDLHGAPLSRTWVKLGADAKKGSAAVELTEAVTGWRVGDKVIVTGTRNPDEIRGGHSTEERTITAIDGAKLTLDKPLENDHLGSGEFRGEVANLSRNVIVESADLKKEARGHTMYHRGSAGGLSYCEFRGLGKEGVLGKYPIHYHLCGATMRGSAVVGVSVRDSGNRWVTVHGTQYLVVRDCVGYKSVGHGFFLEDGTEVFNVFDRNLAVQAKRGKPLPKQVLPFDQNEGAGFWWANSQNAFTRNVTCENGQYGYRFEATAGSNFKPVLPVLRPDGVRKHTDIRTLPFVRFEGNEAHGDGLYGLNLGEGVNRVGPDERHPFVLRDTKIWELHYAFRPQSPNVLVEGMTLHKIAYGVYHPNYENHVYRNLTITRADAEPFNRGHDDLSVQYGLLTVDGLTFKNHGSSSGMPLIQISDDNPTGAAVSHFRNVKVVPANKGSEKRALVNLGGGPRPQPKTPKGVPVYLHDWYGPGQTAKVVSTRAKDLINDGSEYKEETGLTGDESRVAKVKDVPFPELLHPVDDLPPATVITTIVKKENRTLLVRGTCSDNGTVKRVMVNGVAAKSTGANFAEWEAEVPAAAMVSAFGEDEAGNAETQKHVVTIKE
jgi:hypothetical protein